MTVLPEISVVEIESPLTVAVDSGTPIIQITENTDPARVTVIQAQPVTAVIADHKPEVHVRYGRGSLSDRAVLMDLLTDQMDISELTPELRGDILALRDFFGRMGQNLYDFMTDADIERILETAMTLTDEKIQLTALDIVRLEDGIDANMADIEITARSIESQVAHLKWQTDGSFVAQNSLIDQTAEHIESTVLRLDNLMNPDGTQGLVVQMQSQINQEADRITQEVLLRTALDGVVTEQSTLITQTATAIEAVATKTDEETGRLNTATERLTATEKVISILSKGLNDGSYSIETIMALTANSFGVVIEETVGGIPYTAGFEVIMYPIWLLDTIYAIGDLITYAPDNYVYRCIADHTASAVNSPGSDDSALYWEIELEKERTEFNVIADKFKIICPTRGAIPIFSVNGTTNEVEISGELVVNTIKSDSYDAQDPGTSWFFLDAVTGQAKFNNIVMTFSSAEELGEIQDTLGILDGLLFDWHDDIGVALVTNGDYDSGTPFEFDSIYDEGAMIEIEIDDAFVGELMVGFNNITLTQDLFGDSDFGDLDESPTGFDNEQGLTNHRDFASGGFTYEFGGLPD